MATADLNFSSVQDTYERGEQDTISFTAELDDPEDEVDQVRIQPSLERPGGGDVFQQVFDDPTPVGTAGEPNALPLTTGTFNASEVEQGAGRDSQFNIAEDAPRDEYDLNLALKDSSGNTLATESTEIEVVEDESGGGLNLGSFFGSGSGSGDSDDDGGSGGGSGGGFNLGSLFGGGSGSGDSNSNGNNGSSGGGFNLGSLFGGGSGSGNSNGSGNGNSGGGFNLGSLFGGGSGSGGSDDDGGSGGDFNLGSLFGNSESDEVEDNSEEIVELSASTGSQPSQSQEATGSQGSLSGIFDNAQSEGDGPLL